MKNFIVSCFLMTAANGALAAGTSSTVQDSCSNVGFVYLGSDAGITATCLRSDGTPNQTQLLISGISNRNGVLTVSGGSSTFQRTCGSIKVSQQGDALILHARCRNLAGYAQSTSIELKGLSNQNGELSN